MNPNHLLEKYPNGIFPVLEVSKVIGQDPSNVRRKAARLNGVINFNSEDDTLSTGQLKSFLPTYLNGQRQLKGDNREAVKKFLNVLDGNVEVEPSKVEHPVKDPVNNQVRPKIERRVKSQRNATPTEKQSRNGKTLLKGFSLLVAIAAVFFQASHFAELERMDSVFTGTLKNVVSWGIAVGFESLALLLTIFSDKSSRATWAWLIGFGIVAFLMNLCFYQVIEMDLFRKLVLSIALPFSIVATTHLFIQNKS